jgi:uncharacterized protein with PQ loop repeat
VSGLLGYAPIAAACFGVPQLLPQLLKLRATSDSAGVSWSWAALTAVDNAAWSVYFALSRDWTALIPSCSVTLLAGVLTVLLAGKQKVLPHSPVVIGVWTAALAAAGCLSGRVGLGTLLTAGFVVQVAPSLRAAYRTARPSGISAGTWALILGELACFLAYGLHESDPRLVALGSTGVAASTLMLARILWTGLHARNRHGEANARLGEAPAQHVVVDPGCVPHCGGQQRPRRPCRDHRSRPVLGGPHGVSGPTHLG